MMTAQEEMVEHQDVPEAPAVEAPWGYKTNGEPYKVDPANYANRPNNGGRRKRAGARTAAAGAPPRRATPNTRKPPPGPDYAGTLMGFVQIGASAAIMAGRALKNKALMADGCAAILHGPPMMEALAEMAVDNRQFAALLDKVTVIGPYSKLIAAGIPFFMQILVNHKGGKPPTQMAEAFGVMSAGALIERVSGVSDDGGPERPADD